MGDDEDVDGTNVEFVVNKNLVPSGISGSFSSKGVDKN